MGHTLPKFELFKLALKHHTDFKLENKIALNFAVVLCHSIQKIIFSFHVGCTNAVNCVKLWCIWNTVKTGTFDWH